MMTHLQVYNMTRTIQLQIAQVMGGIDRYAMMYVCSDFKSLA